MPYQDAEAIAVMLCCLLPAKMSILPFFHFSHFFCTDRVGYRGFVLLILPDFSGKPMVVHHSDTAECSGKQNFLRIVGVYSEFIWMLIALTKGLHD